jgi:hypothetical protein
MARPSLERLQQITSELFHGYSASVNEKLVRATDFIEDATQSLETKDYAAEALEKLISARQLIRDAQLALATAERNRVAKDQTDNATAQMTKAKDEAAFAVNEAKDAQIAQLQHDLREANKRSK